MIFCCAAVQSPGTSGTTYQRRTDYLPERAGKSIRRAAGAVAVGVARRHAMPSEDGNLKNIYFTEGPGVWTDPRGANVAPFKGSKTIIWPSPNKMQFEHYVYGVVWKIDFFG